MIVHTNPRIYRLVLGSDGGLEALREADDMGQRYRVDGVPFFIVNGKITLGGAQPPEAFMEAFEKEQVRCSEGASART